MVSFFGISMSRLKILTYFRSLVIRCTAWRQWKENDYLSLAWQREVRYCPRKYSRRTNNNRSDCKRQKVHVSSTTSLTQMTCSVASSTLSTTYIMKVCRTYNQNSLADENSDKRLILSNKYTHLPPPSLSIGLRLSTIYVVW